MTDLPNVKAHWVPKLKSTWDEIHSSLWAESFLQKYEGDSIQRAIYNCDETWLLSQKLRKPRQKAPGEEPPVIPKIKKVQRKVMAVFFWHLQLLQAIITMI